MSLETTTLDRRWLTKMIIFFGVLVFFGFYGLYDATIAYPNRGIRHASYCEFQYLDTARERGMLDRRLSVENPAEEFQRLRQASVDGRVTELELTRMVWLRSLSRVGRLQPEFTSIQEPTARFTELQQEWTTAQGAGRNAPKELAAYDIPVQWLFVIIGFGGGAWMGGLFLAVRRVKYRWEAESQTLHIPIANTDHMLTPADVEEFDKRKWHKYLVFLKVRPEHATLGGRELKLDLYRHAHLERWILAMEKTAFPEHFQEPESQEPSEAAAPAESDEDRISV